MLVSLINTLSKEESSLFKSYLRSKNKREDTKNIELYQLLRKGVNPKNIDTLLYGKPNRNAYHALSKRVQDSLIDFIATRNFQTETSEDMQVFKWILTARILYEQNLPLPAQKILKKATLKASALDLQSALLESYHTQLQYSHLHPDIDLNTLTKEAQQCQQDLLKQETLNIAYAHLKRKLIFSPETIQQPLQDTITQTLHRFNIDPKTGLTFKSLYQLLELINTAAHLDHNYKEALPFIQTTYTAITQKQSAATKHRFYNIQVVYIMANTFFRLRDFRQSQNYLDQMLQEMHAHQNKYHDRFLPKYLLIKSLIDNYTGNAQEAIHLLTSQKKKAVQTDPDIALALTMYYVQQAQYKQSLSTLNVLKHSDRWYENTLGKDWLIKKDLITLIIYYELEYIDLFQSHLRRFRREHKAVLNVVPRVQHFIAVISRLHGNPLLVDELRFRESVKTHFTTSNLAQEDIFMLSFFAWIKAKLNKTPLYKTTLELL